MNRIVRKESKGFFERLFQGRQMDAPEYTRLCKEWRFNREHKLFKDLKKVTPESFTFDTTVTDYFKENDKYTISWKVNYELCETNNYFSVRNVEVILGDKLRGGYIAYVEVEIAKIVYLDDKCCETTKETDKKYTIRQNADDMTIKFGGFFSKLVAKNDFSNFSYVKDNNLVIRVRVHLLFEDESANRVIENYESYVKSEESCNVELIVGEKKFSAHREILSAHSLYFKSFFEGNWKEKSENKVKIDDVQPNIFKHLLDYIYFADIDCKVVDDWLKIIVAADKYLINSLYKLSEDCLCYALDAENFSDVFTVADLVNSKKLKTKCVVYLARNKEDILKTKGYKNLVKTREDLATELLSHVMSGCDLYVSNFTEEN